MRVEYLPSQAEKCVFEKFQIFFSFPDYHLFGKKYIARTQLEYLRVVLFLRFKQAKDELI